MIPVLLHLGPIPIYSFGVMAALGFLAADFTLTLECRRRGIDPGLADSVVVWAALAGFAGSRIYDVFDNWSNYMAHPWSIVFSGAGFVWYGGLIGGIISTWLVTRHYKLRFVTVADMCAAPLILGQAFGRMGCLLSGDGDWGLPSTLPWAMAFPKAIVGWHGDLHLKDGSFIPATVLKLDPHGMLVDGFFPGVRVHPTPLYEVAMFLAIFAVMWSLRTRASFPGQQLCLYLILAGVERFVVEFLRINPRVLWGFSEAQLISLVSIAVGVATWLWLAGRQPAIEPGVALRAST
jgi:phosphatidylglycerol---prolipoprotein diacylglyceryl transferase